MKYLSRYLSLCNFTERIVLYVIINFSRLPPPIAVRKNSRQSISLNKFIGRIASNYAFATPDVRLFPHLRFTGQGYKNPHLKLKYLVSISPNSAA